MDSEGFSGRDGRTTIFDYWSVDTLCRADSGQLTDDEQQLANIYDKVLEIAQKEKAVSDGMTFDLMYVNQQDQRQYAFLRRSEKSLLFVVVNFDDVPVELGITIPAHAFDYLCIKEKTYSATDLLTDEKTKLTLKRDTAVPVSIKARGGVVFKMVNI